MARKGFTLLEVLAVVVIVLILAGLMFGMMNVIEKERINTTNYRIHTLRCAVAEHRLTKGQLPLRLEDLAKKLDQTPPMKDGKFIDSWERPFEYTVNGKEFDLWSCAPDGVSGTPDDLHYVKN